MNSESYRWYMVVECMYTQVMKEGFIFEFKVEIGIELSIAKSWDLEFWIMPIGSTESERERQ